MGRMRFNQTFHIKRRLLLDYGDSIHIFKLLNSISNKLERNSITYLSLRNEESKLERKYYICN